jgi:hypothetical protein
MSPNQDAILLDGQVQITHQNLHITAEHVKIRMSSGAVEIGAQQVQPLVTPPMPQVTPVTQWPPDVFGVQNLPLPLNW